MSKAIAISRAAITVAPIKPADIASSVIVLACGLALIFAGPVLPV